MSKNKKSGFFANLFGINHIKQNFNYTKYSWNKLLQKNEDKKETFFDACVRFNIIGDSNTVNNILSKKYSEIKKIFYIKFLFFILVFLLSMYYLFSSIMILNFLMCLLLSFAFLVFSAKDSYNCYQINQRKLGCFKEWLYNTKVFFPTYFREMEFSVLVDDSDGNDNLNINEEKVEE